VSDATAEIVKQARYMRNAAPQQFRDFYTAIINYQMEQLDQLVQATDNLQVAQGRAQQCIKFALLLNEAMTREHS